MMLNQDEIRQAILEALGHPESGPIVDHLDIIVNAINEKQRPALKQPETRIVAPDETRTTTPATMIK